MRVRVSHFSEHVHDQTSSGHTRIAFRSYYSFSKGERQVRFSCRVCRFYGLKKHIDISEQIHLQAAGILKGFLPEHLDQNIHLSSDHSRTSDFGGAREVTERIGGFLVLPLSNGERRVGTRVRSVASRKQSLRCASSTARSDPRTWRFSRTAVTVTRLGETS